MSTSWKEKVGQFAQAADEKLSLVEYLGAQDHTKLRRQGREYRGRCPLCHSSNPGCFAVNPRTNEWYCFRCAKGGGIYRYVKEKFGLDTIGALELLASLTGLSVPGRDWREERVARATAVDAGHMRDAVRYALRLYRLAARKYAAEAAAAATALGLDPAVLTRYALGYVPTGQRLAANMQAGPQAVPLERWPAFLTTGLVGYDGEPGSAYAVQTLVEHAPAGALVWPVMDRGRFAGLAAFTPDGHRAFVTQPVRELNPMRGVLLLEDAAQVAAGETVCVEDGWCGGTLPGDPPGLGAVDRDDAPPLLLWASPLDFFRHGAQAPGRHLVPSWKWEPEAYPTAVRPQCRHETPVGVRVPGDAPADAPAERETGESVAGPAPAWGTLGFWAVGALLESVGGVADAPQAGTSAVCPPRHVLEVLVAEDPTLDVSDYIDAMGDPIARLAAMGWWTEWQAGARPRWVTEREAGGHAAPVPAPVAPADDAPAAPAPPTPTPALAAFTAAAFAGAA